MKNKELIKLLSALDPEATVVVQEYDGCDDACRQVTSAKLKQANQLSWPSGHWKGNKLIPYQPPAGPFVYISGLRGN